MPLKSWSQLAAEAEEPGSFSVLPAGDYPLIVEKSETKQSQKGNLYFMLTCVVIDGPYKGRKLWHNITVTHDNPTALGFFFRSMTALGIDRTWFGSNPSDDLVAQTMVNRSFIGQVVISPYNGEDRNSIKTMKPMTASATPGVAAPPAPAAPAPATPAATPPPPAPPVVETPPAPPTPEVPPLAEAAAPPAPPAELPPPPPPGQAF